MDDAFHDAMGGVADLTSRILARDPTVWQAEPHAAHDRLGWLDAPRRSLAHAHEWSALVRDMVADGVTDVLMVGVGAPVRYARILAELVEDPLVAVHVLDTVHPDAVARWRGRFDPATWALVVSGSGTTPDTASLAERFWADLVEALGEQAAADHVVVITDPDGELATLATQRGWRGVVACQSDVEDRFAALTAVGMFPAALMGLDLTTHLRPAQDMLDVVGSPDLEVNSPARLGAFMGAAVLQGRSQLTVALEPDHQEYGVWLQQLVAESISVHDRGLLAVVNEPVMEPVAYGPLRWLVAIGEHHGLRAVADSGTPVVALPSVDLATLTGEVVRWQFATVVAAAILGCNPFAAPDEPTAGGTPDRIAAPDGSDLATEPADDLVEWLDSADYLTLVAWVDTAPEVTERFEEAAGTLRRRFGIPVTISFGPRRERGSDQLSWTGPAGGAFAVIVDVGTAVVDVPGRDLDFATLFQSGVAADVRTLRAGDRVVAVVDLDDLLAA